MCTHADGNVYNHRIYIITEIFKDKPLTAAHINIRTVQSNIYSA